LLAVRAAAVGPGHECEHDDGLGMSVDLGMRIRELEEGGAGPVGEHEEGEEVGARIGGEVVRLKAKRMLVGASARVLSYLSPGPTKNQREKEKISLSDVRNETT
jgi:hypothetical protein